MKGVYTANIAITGITAAKTLIYLTAASSKVVEILECAIENYSNETNEQLRAAWQKITTLGTPTGTSLTPSKAEDGDQAAGTTAVGNVTASEPTYGSNTEQGYKGFSSLAGYAWCPTPECRIYIPPSGSWGLRLLDTPASFNCLAWVTFREIG